MLRHILRRLAIVLGLLFAVLVILGLRFLIEGGAFQGEAPQFAGTCKSVDLGGATVRDMVIDRNAGAVYLSLAAPSPGAKGTLKRLDLNSDMPTLTDAVSAAPAAFDPHELALFGDLGFERMFVVSRPAGERTTVEMFEPALEGGLWKHTANLRDTRFRDPADIAALSHSQFYLANRSTATNAFQRLGEMLFNQGPAAILYFNADRTATVIPESSGAGGIAASPDGAIVYVAETLARQIRTYTVDPLQGRLTPKGTIKVPGAPLHIDVDELGTLWVAADPRFSLDLPRASAGAPSQVIRVADPESDNPGVTEIYRDAGSTFAGTHVATMISDLLVLGSAVETRIQLCTAK